MAQGYDKYELDNQTGQSFRFALNDILEASATQNSGDNSPNTTNTSYPYQVWVDTTNDIVKIRDAATAGSWYSLYSVDSDGKPTGAVSYGSYTIATNDTAGTGGTPAITVDTSQRVGIQQTNPAAPLDVGGAILSKTSTAGISDQSITFTESGSGNSYGVRLGHASNTELAFERYDGGWVETVRIDGAGSAKIGTGTGTNAVTINGGASSTSVNQLIFQGGGTNNPSAAIEYDAGDKGLAFQVGNYSTLSSSEAGRFDTSGRLLLGTASSTKGKFVVKAGSSGEVLGAYESSAGGNYGGNGTYKFARYFHGYWGTAQECASIGFVGTSSGAGSGYGFGDIVFNVGSSGNGDSGSTSTERMKLFSDGILQIRTQSNNGFVCASQQGSGTSNFIFQGGHSSTGPGSYTPSFRVDTAGNIYSTNTSITGISDINLKENIVDAKSQWDDIKNLHLVNYNFKEETGHLTHKQLGLIAQEVEQICPSVVQDIADESTGEVTKGVRYSLIWMKAVGALQEAMERIEELEAKVAALESA